MPSASCSRRRCAGSIRGARRSLQHRLAAVSPASRSRCIRRSNSSSSCCGSSNRMCCRAISRTSNACACHRICKFCRCCGGKRCLARCRRAFCSRVSTAARAEKPIGARRRSSRPRPSWSWRVACAPTMLQRPSASSGPLASMCPVALRWRPERRVLSGSPNLFRPRVRPSKEWNMNAIETETERADTLTALLAGRIPDDRGRYGPFGGRYVPETLIPAHERLERGVRRWLADREFRAELERELRDWVGRPTALSAAPHLSKRWGARVWLKREDLAHTGAHKINNAIGQALLARRLGARRVVAETGAGQHGVASAAAAARLGMPCVVYMGAVDVERQAPNVGRMQLFGARVVGVSSGDRTLRAAIDEAMRDWVADPVRTYYLLGSAVGAHPYPYLVRELQSVIGQEARAQLLEQRGALPDVVVACVGG